MSLQVGGIAITPSLVALAGLSLLVAVYFLFFRSEGYAFPPGPKGEPILNHLRTVPVYDEGRIYHEMGKELKSDLVGVKLINNPVVIINSVSAANELLDKRGNINSDRPVFWYGNIMGYVHTLSFMGWNNRMKIHRKVIQRELSKSYIQKYQPIQAAEIRNLMVRSVSPCVNLERKVRRAATSVILGIAFGHTIRSDEDKYIEIAVNASEGLGAVSNAGTCLLDIFPLARYLPNWLAPPGLIWAREHREAARIIHEVPCEELKANMANGTASPCLLSSLLDDIHNGNSHGLTEQDAQGAAVTMYAAGQDTTTVSIMNFFVNLLVHPDIQRKGQEEIDRVVGKDRLPEYDDRPNLPYIEHCLWECFRFFPATPIGLSHKSTAPQTYRNYFFPKGTVLIPNAYAMTHDEEVYSNPDVFDPTRYDRGEPAPIGQWGFGRRICPGQHLASQTIWLTIATAFATVNVLPLLDESGKEIPFELKFSEGFGLRVDDFDCRVEYRSPEAKSLLHHVDQE